MTAEISKVLESNWEQVQENIGKTWRKLKDTDIKSITNYDDLVDKLKSAYSIEEDAVKAKIEDFIDRYELEADVSKMEALKQSLQNSLASVKEKVGETIKDSVDTTKQKTEEIATASVAYAKENPLKLLGLGVLATLAIKKLLVKKAD